MNACYIYNVCHGRGFHTPQEAKACKFHYVSYINEGLVLLKLADTVLILINTGPSNESI